ncbi:MAG: electron transport complex protein RnfA [Bacteroidales bacterium]|jgi:electron transport complex protein RnfA|nr:electron transport complex protein RnfA [Bacteroidales bacterium]
MQYILIIIAAIFVNNIVLTQFLGICPFLGVSNKVKTSMGMGAAVVFVMVLSTTVTWLIYTYILAKFNIEFMQTVTYILVIAGLVQMIELILKKISPSLYQALGVFLPLITTNCTILGVALLVIQKNYNLITSVLFAIGMSVGFTLALVILAGIREHIDKLSIPKGMKGIPIVLIIAGILAMAFMGFSGMIK